MLPAPGYNGQHGHLIFGRRGIEMLDRNQFDAFQKAAAFPKTLLHPLIADRVWISLARGELADGVFAAFRAVDEEKVFWTFRKPLLEKADFRLSIDKGGFF